MELAVGRDPGGAVRYRQRATYLPKGLLGHLYWWAVSPFHGLVFGAMVRNIRVAAGSQPAARQWPGGDDAARPAPDHAVRRVW